MYSLKDSRGGVNVKPLAKPLVNGAHRLFSVAGRGGLQ